MSSFLYNFLQISELVKVVREDSLAQLKPIQFKDENPIIPQNFDYKNDSDLFDLYKVLRNFSQYVLITSTHLRVTM